MQSSTHWYIQDFINSNLQTFLHSYKHTYIKTYILTCTHTCMYIHTQTCRHIHNHTFNITHIHVYECTHVLIPSRLCTPSEAHIKIYPEKWRYLKQNYSLQTIFMILLFFYFWSPIGFCKTWNIYILEKSDSRGHFMGNNACRKPYPLPPSDDPWGSIGWIWSDGV